MTITATAAAHTHAHPHEAAAPVLLPPDRWSRISDRMPPLLAVAVQDIRARVPMLRSGPVRDRPFDIRDFIDGQAAFYAGTANVIMQLGWPAVGRGVFESKVDSGNIMKAPRKRARTTITYLAVALMGSEDERAFLREEVNRQHRQVRSGEDSPVKYNAFSRDLQLWVAACIRRALGKPIV